MRRRPFSSYTDAFFRVKSLTELAIDSAEKMTVEQNRKRAAMGHEPRPVAELERWKAYIRQTRAELNRLLRKHYGK